MLPLTPVFGSADWSDDEAPTHHTLEDDAVGETNPGGPVVVGAETTRTCNRYGVVKATRRMRGIMPKRTVLRLSSAFRVILESLLNSWYFRISKTRYPMFAVVPEN